MNGRYKELDELEQGAILRLINTIAASSGLLDHDRTVADITRLTADLDDRASLIMYRHAETALCEQLDVLAQSPPQED